MDNIKEIDETSKNNNCKCCKSNNGLSNYNYEYLNKSIYKLIELTLSKEIDWKLSEAMYKSSKYNVELYKNYNNCIVLKQNGQTIYWKHFNVDDYKIGAYEEVDLLIQLFALISQNKLPLFNVVDNFINTVYWNK